MAQQYRPGPVPRPMCDEHGLLNKILGLDGSGSSIPTSATSPLHDTLELDGDIDANRDIIRRVPREVIPRLPRSQTFKRQQEERREHLAPVEPSLNERRGTSTDRRSNRPGTASQYSDYSAPRHQTPLSVYSASEAEYGHMPYSAAPPSDTANNESTRMTHAASTDVGQSSRSFPTPVDVHSMTPMQFDALIHDELERIWILNLSMHFRDHSKREKFFVTYRETEQSWRRVTISLDYRRAEPGSLEMDLMNTKYQRDKSAKIYEAIRESLTDIEFYDTVTNLKLETTDGRLHVHVVEDGNEIIDFPPVNVVRHLQCRRVRERDVGFISHMSAFVYKVRADDRVLIKKEIPSPETIEEFLYEINALHALQFSSSVIQFYGVIVDDDDEHVKGLLIDHAEQGALMDIIFDNCKDSHIGIPWSTREKWARQIIKGLADIHETGFVQGDFTLSNIVIDGAGNAKIIDINRRGCPLGWEPPEASALLECNQRLSLFIGVKSDLYQLGMVLWALAMTEDEPETQGRPLMLGPEVNIPDWYRRVTEICLSYDPRSRLHASQLLQIIPPAAETTSEESDKLIGAIRPVQHTNAAYSLLKPHPVVQPLWSDKRSEHNASARPLTYDPFYTSRGRSPPSPNPSDASRALPSRTGWAAHRTMAPSFNSIDSKITPPFVGPDDRSLPSRQSHISHRPKLRDSYSMPRSTLRTEMTSPGVSAGDGAVTPKGEIWNFDVNGARPPLDRFKSYGHFRSDAMVGPHETRIVSGESDSRFGDWMDMGKIRGHSNPELADAELQAHVLQLASQTAELDALEAQRPVAERPRHLERQDTIRTSFYNPDDNDLASNDVASNGIASNDVASWISRVSTPDCEIEGGAQLARSETDDPAPLESIVDKRLERKLEIPAPTPELPSGSFENVTREPFDAQTSFAPSLAGIGSAHGPHFERDCMAEIRIGDDDFTTLKRNETISTM